MYNIHDDINDFINTNIKNESLTTQFVYNFLQARVENDTSILEYQLDNLLNKLENNNSDFANIIRLGVTKDTNNERYNFLHTACNSTNLNFQSSRR